MSTVATITTPIKTLTPTLSRGERATISNPEWLAQRELAEADFALWIEAQANRHAKSQGQRSQWLAGKLHELVAEARYTHSATPAELDGRMEALGHGKMIL